MAATAPTYVSTDPSAAPWQQDTGVTGYAPGGLGVPAVEPAGYTGYTPTFQPTTFTNTSPTGAGATPTAAAPPPASAAPPTASTGGSYTGDPTDVNAWLSWQATQPGHDPILDTPQGKAYYANAITTNGGLNAGNIAYWGNKSTLASAGGAVGAGGGTGGGVGGGFGSLYQMPSAADAMNLPGYQFAYGEGQRAVQTSAAAKGTLLTGGTLKDLATYGSGQALSQSYLPLANLNLSYANGYAGTLSGLAGLGAQNSTSSATGSPGGY